MTANTAAVSELERATMRRVAWRILPFLIVCYPVSYTHLTLPTIYSV